jgi:hypothetical protein
MRMTAIWFGSLDHRIQGCGAMIRARGLAPLGSLVCKVDPAAGGWTGNAPRQGSRLRARFAAYGLDPSAFPVLWLVIGALRRRSAKKQGGDSRTPRS